MMVLRSRPVSRRPSTTPSVLPIELPSSSSKRRANRKHKNGRCTNVNISPCNSQAHAKQEIRASVFNHLQRFLCFSLLSGSGHVNAGFNKSYGKTDRAGYFANRSNRVPEGAAALWIGFVLLLSGREFATPRLAPVLPPS